MATLPSTMHIEVDTAKFVETRNAVSLDLHALASQAACETRQTMRRDAPHSNSTAEQSIATTETRLPPSND